MGHPGRGRHSLLCCCFTARKGQSIASSAVLPARFGAFFNKLAIFTARGMRSGHFAVKWNELGAAAEAGVEPAASGTREDAGAMLGGVASWAPPSWGGQGGAAILARSPLTGGRSQRRKEGVASAAMRPRALPPPPPGGILRRGGRGGGHRQVGEGGTGPSGTSGWVRAGPRHPKPGGGGLRDPISPLPPFPGAVRAHPG